MPLNGLTRGRPAPPPVRRKPPERDDLPLLSVVGGLCLGLFLAVVGVVAFSIVRPGQVEVAHVVTRRWERGFHVEAPVTLVEEDWQVPDGAQVLDSFPVVREYREMPDGWVAAEVFDSVARLAAPGRGSVRYPITVEREEGAGTAARAAEASPGTVYRQVFLAEPVHAMRYRYKIERWESVESRRRWGSGGTTPEWPPADLAPHQRVQRWQWYQFTLLGPDGRVYSARVTAEEFARLPVGARVVMEARGASARVVKEAAPPGAEDRP